jgi:putative membrane protein
VSEPHDAEQWSRLDKRMLLIGPAKALKEFAIPAIIAVVGITSRDSASPMWLVPGVLGLLVIGFIPWFTTTFRITPTQFQLRKGLLNKEQLTAPLDRVRSVDLESSLLHRILGLSKVQIGTGVDDTRIELNALSEEQAESLRVFLLAKSTAAPVADGAVETVSDDRHEAPLSPPSAATVELAAIDWSWLRFAPLSFGRLVLLAGAFGAVSQFGDDLPFLDWNVVGSGWDRVAAVALPVAVALGFLSALTAWLIVSIGGYVVQWWNLRLTRDNGSLRLTAGLFTTRSTSIEESRIRGVELTEPGLLRLVGGAELSALATGVGAGGATKVLPPSPRSVATRVGESILDIRDPEASEPLSVELARHGPIARRRCHVRAQEWTLLWLIVASPVAYLASTLTWPVLAVTTLVWAAGGALVGEYAYRNLGHALTSEHLVAGDGALQRRRIALETEGVIGWVVKQTLFQRRVGLATLIATTAAGAESVEIKDIPHQQALTLAHRATPGVLTPFLASR